MNIKNIFSQSERRILSGLNSPKKIQDFIDTLGFTLDENEPYYSPRRVLEQRTADCIEGAVFAAAALRFHGHRPLILDLTAVRDDDHVIALFKKNSHWGAISKSKYTGLGYREPVHLNSREIALSYFEGYFNYDGEKTLRAYSRPADLSRFDKLGWMTTEEPIKFIEDYLNKMDHYYFLANGIEQALRRVTPIVLEAGELWMRRNGLREKAKALFDKNVSRNGRNGKH